MMTSLFQLSRLLTALLLLLLLDLLFLEKLISVSLLLYFRTIYLAPIVTIGAHDSYGKDQLAVVQSRGAA